MSEEYIEVRIIASQTVRYAQTVNMSVDDYEKYQRLVDSNARDDKFQEIAERYLDLSEISDAFPLEDVEVRRWTPKVGTP